MVIRWSAILLALGSSLWAADRLTVGYRQAPPMTSHGLNGTPAGFAVAAFSEAARRAGVELSWHEVPRSETMEAGLDQAQFDILPYAADTPDRRARYYVSEPWWWWELSLLTRENTGIRSSEGVGNKRLALAAAAYRSTADGVFPGARMFVPASPHPGARAAIEAVCKGDAEAALLSHADVHALLSEGLGACRAGKLLPLDTPAVMGLSIVARRPIQATAERLAIQMRRMADDGTLLALAAKHPVPALGAVRLADTLRLRYERRSTVLITVSSLALLCTGILFALRRSRSARKLRDSEERYRAFFEQAAVGMAEVEARTHRLLRVNKAFSDLLGYSAEELSGKDLASITHPDDLVSNVEQYDRFTSGQIPSYCLEKRYVRKDGEPVWVRVEAAGVRAGGEGPVAYTIGVAHNITGRRKMEEQLRASEHRFRSALANAPFPAILHNESGEILQTSRAWSEITGYSAEEVRTMADWTARAYRDDAGAVPNHVETLSSRHDDDRLDEGEYVVRTASGEERAWLFASAAVGRDDAGRRLVLSMAADITELKKAQQQIRVLEGLLPICAGCKKIRDEGGQWQQIESYISDHSEATFSHGMCPTCEQKYFPRLGVA